MKHRLAMSTATGEADLAWSLVQLFFLTTFIATRPGAESSAAAAPSGDPTVTISIHLDPDGTMTVEDPGEMAPPSEPVETWLSTTCQQAHAVVLTCPDEVPHRQCRDAIELLMSWGPGCTYSY